VGDARRKDRQAVSASRVPAFLWVAQRVTAAFLALFVLVHIATILYAVRGGLSASEILARTHANLAWPLFYALFVFAASIHGAIGLRTVAHEWLRWRGWTADLAMALIGLALLVLGMRAVVAIAA
jgi:fumarate reductase subunit C